MPRRKQLNPPDAATTEIDTAALIRRLHDHVFAAEDQLTALQIRAIQVLLAKTMPDIRSVEHAGGLASTHEDALDRLDDADTD